MLAPLTTLDCIVRLFAKLSRAMRGIAVKITEWVWNWVLELALALALALASA